MQKVKFRNENFVRKFFLCITAVGCLVTAEQQENKSSEDTNVAHEQVLLTQQGYTGSLATYQTIFFNDI